ncbi:MULTISPECIES: hypothetical protein [unclassified Methylobacterium]|uniref:hypothetical protein n=1 Tax=unclassified Methylobacterium TaxID=2615210 RepID=UPI0012E18F63|nr:MULTISPECIES: hypothetical protein [unclassified Methylobacterium]
MAMQMAPLVAMLTRLAPPKFTPPPVIVSLLATVLKVQLSGVIGPTGTLMAVAPVSVKTADRPASIGAVPLFGLGPGL